MTLDDLKRRERFLEDLGEVTKRHGMWCVITAAYENNGEWFTAENFGNLEQAMYASNMAAYEYEKKIKKVQAP